MATLQFSSASVDHFGAESEGKAPTHLPVHIRVQQRRGKKCLTIVEGLAEDLDLKKISKALRSTHSTSCSIISNKETGQEVLQLAGDLRTEIKQFLIETNIADARQIKLHGY